MSSLLVQDIFVDVNYPTNTKHDTSGNKIFEKSPDLNKKGTNKLKKYDQYCVLDMLNKFNFFFLLVKSKYKYCLEENILFNVIILCDIF